MQTRECVVVKILQPTKHKQQLLEDLQGLFGAAVQLGLGFAKENNTSGRNKIHHGCYYKIRNLGLLGDYARMAINQAVSLARGHYGMCKSKHFKKVSWPVIRKILPLGLGIYSYKLIYTGNHWVLRVSLGNNNFLWLPLCVPDKFHDKMSLVYGDAEIYCRSGKWYVKLPVRLPLATPVISEDAQFIGIDLGIAKVATVVGPNFVRFFSGKAIQNKRRRFQEYRRRMGRKKRLDKIRANKGKESQWMKDVNHKVSREIADLAVGVPNGVLVMENLSGIRNHTKSSKRFNRMMSNWAFRQLKDMIVYKAKRAGVPVVFVDPRGTSKTCSKCGHSSRANRPDQAHFQCVSCGYQVNSDYNAAVNISRKGLEAHSDALPGTA